MKQYLLERKKIMIMFLLFGGIFFIVLWLYRQPLEAVLYAFLLCLACGIAVGLFDYFTYRKRMSALGEVTSDLELLPTPVTQEAERYQELLQQFEQEKRRIEAEAAEDKSRLTEYYTLWVHQIKTPIAAMDLLLQQEEISPRELSLELSKIGQYVELALAYVRLGSESSDFVLQPYALDDMIRQAVRKFASAFIYKKLSLNFTETHQTVITDEKWLGLVLEQILSNAVKYTREGSVSISMEDGWLVIADTGIGIAAEDLPRVFEQGFTGYNGRKDKKSTGIGLYLCKTILDRLSHEIRMESEPGVGTKVFLNLESREWSGGRPE